VNQREKEDEMTSFLDSHQSAAAVNKKLRFETSHEPILVILYNKNWKAQTNFDVGHWVTLFIYKLFVFFLRSLGLHLS